MGTLAGGIILLFAISKVGALVLLLVFQAAISLVAWSLRAVDTALQVAPCDNLRDVPQHADIFDAIGASNGTGAYKRLSLQNDMRLQMHELVADRDRAPVFKPAELEIRKVGAEMKVW